MAKVQYFHGNMTPVTGIEHADKAQVIMADGSIAVQASLVYGIWHYSAGSTSQTRLASSTIEMELILRDYIAAVNAGLTSETIRE